MDPSTQNVLIAKRGRMSKNSGQWNFFGGNIDPHETPLTAALRELDEESGIRPNPSDVVFSGKIQTEKRIIHYFVFYFSRYMMPDLNHESSTYRWVPLKRVSAVNGLHKPTARILGKITK